MSRFLGIWNAKTTGEVLKKAAQKLWHANLDETRFLGFTSQNLQTTHSQPHAESNYSTAIAICGSENLCQNKITVALDGYILNLNELTTTHQLPPSLQPCEIIARVYQSFGTKIFEKLDGAWAMAIFDNEKLILARDRFGIKPLLYGNHNHGIAFASTASALLELTTARPQWSEEKFLQFVVYGATHNPHETFFEQIETVKPGCFITWSLHQNQPEQTRYYDLPSRIARSFHTDSSFETLFRESITKNSNTAHLGALLSGGLDSSLIVSEILKVKPTGFQTFTCAFPGSSIDESAYAAMLGAENPALQQHFTTPQAIDFYNHFDELIRIHERPVGSASVFVQWYTMKYAAQNQVKVIMDGQGADEIFGGYYTFAGAYLIALLKSGDIAGFQSELKALQQNFNPHMFRAMLRSAFYLLPRQLQFLARKQNRLGADLIARNYKAKAAKLTAPQRGSTDFVELSLRSVEFGLYEILQYADKNATAHGLESRMPFLDHRVIEHAIGMDVNRKIKKGWTKLPIRKLLAANGFEKLAWRKDKLGFVAPQDQWRAEVGNMFFEKIKTAPIPDILNRKKMNMLFKDSLYSRSAQTEFWRLLALLRWMQIFDVELVPGNFENR